MPVRRLSFKIRKIHRYLGVFLGIQFLLWTLSGLYFSWTDIDEIHGDHYKNMEYQAKAFKNLVSPSRLPVQEGIRSIELREINNNPYYWVNGNQLFNARTGEAKAGINEKEALAVAKRRLIPTLAVAGVERIEQVDNHHEYRSGPLPAYVISFKNSDNLKAYVSIKDGKLQTIRHRSWRWFDFLWMSHTMDYKTRDNFNTLVLRAFSLLGLITVLSGFTLWYVSSPLRRRINKST
ncbi:MAG TPA: hypothetical protein ENK44_01990 [Caldithrix abyssi]|uniref:PepSY domain-containing protein n=1 Tax=Caldithrix abyssi TaxID=187145 RepID=A0A7V4WUL9_CALAY|nr:hypothetical protein [Caldithrix abyssi]